MNKRQDSWQNRSRLHSYKICLVEAATDWRSGIRFAHLTLDICSLNYSCTHLKVPVASSSRRRVPPACHRPCCALSCLLQAPERCPEGLAQLNRQGLREELHHGCGRMGVSGLFVRKLFFSLHPCFQLGAAVPGALRRCTEHAWARKVSASSCSPLVPW